MRKKIKPVTYIYLIDELKHLSEDLANQFSNKEKYQFSVLSTERQFFEKFKKETPPSSGIKILIFVVNRHLNIDNPVEEVLLFLNKLKQVSQGVEVIIVSSQKTHEIEEKVLEAGASALIMDNENALLRIDNHVKGTISKHTIWKKRKASLLALRIFIAYIFLSLLFALISYFVFPEYF